MSACGIGSTEPGAKNSHHAVSMEFNVSQAETRIRTGQMLDQRCEGAFTALRRGREQSVGLSIVLDLPLTRQSPYL